MSKTVIAGCKVCDHEREFTEVKFKTGRTVTKRARLHLSAHSSHCSGDFTDTYIKEEDE